MLALRQLLDLFLKAAGESAWRRPQVLSLGAGFDTTFFHMQVLCCAAMIRMPCTLHEGRQGAPSTLCCTAQAQGLNTARWYEVDFLSVTQKKAAVIAAHQDLRQLIGGDAGLAVSAGGASTC